MAEYKLDYTASEINEKLGKIDDTTIKVGETLLTEETLKKLIDLTITKFAVTIVNDTDYTLRCTVDGVEVALIETYDAKEFSFKEGTQVLCRLLNDDVVETSMFFTNNGFEFTDMGFEGVLVTINQDGSFIFE